MVRFYYATAIFYILFITTSYAVGKNYLPGTYTISGGFFTGPVIGYTQIPIGGTPGTSSQKRPTLKELGIKNSSDFDLQLASDWYKFGVYLGWQRLRFHKLSVLSKTLTTQGIIIPAGSTITTCIRDDWYRLGAKYRFYFDASNASYIAPGLEVAMWSFEYRLLNTAVLRRFPQYTVRAGVSARYNINKKLFLLGDVKTSLPVTYLHIMSISAQSDCLFYRASTFSVIGFLGISYLYLDFKDRQTMPNHIKYIACPRLLFGLKIKF